MPQGGNGGGPAKGVNKILGNWKDNILIGTDGIDVISGRGGNDILTGGLGGDTLDGGDGVDTASYAGSAAGVSIDLAAGTASGGDAEGETLIAIENLEGSDFADSLSGDDGANVLTGGGGDDWLFGANGNDVLTGGAGNDQYVFHVADPLLGELPDGDDIITYFQIGSDKIRFTNPEFDVLSGAAQVGSDVAITYGAGSTITLLNTQLAALSSSDFLFPGPNVITGTEFGDTLTGTAGVDEIFGLGGDDILDGAAGNDIVRGEAGDDILFGGAGDDTLLGGTGGDQLVGGSGADLLDGGDGNDWAIYAASAAGVSVDLATGAASGGDAEGDTLVAIETVFGSNFADTLSGDGGANLMVGSGGDDVVDGLGGDDLLSGDAGADLILGGAGNDLLHGGADADDLQGGAGSDTASYTGSTAVNIDLASGVISGGDADGDTFTSIENLQGSDGADILTGDAGANAIDGQGGNDTISGGAGDDNLSAFSGDNNLDGGAGNDFLAVNGTNFDTMTGGSGADTFSLVAEGLVIGPDPSPPIVATTTITDFDPGIDRIIFPVPFDVLAAAQQVGSDVLIEFSPGLSVLLLNTLFGDLMAGDFLFGNQIVGTEGADTLLGTPQDDLISGLGGDDTLIGNGGDDVLDGDGGDDTIFGGAGNDEPADIHGNNTLDGGAGDDFLAVNGSNLDTMTGGSGADTFSLVAQLPYLNGTIATTTITDFEIGIDKINFSSSFDVLAAAQQLGSDVSIEFSPGLSVLLLDTQAGDLLATDFVFVGLNLILGTEGADVLIGTDGGDNIVGRSGDDILSAKDGDDLLGGDIGNDTLFGGSGNDTLMGGVGDDFLVGRDGDDILSGGGGADVFAFRIPPTSVPTIPTLDGLGTDTITNFEIGIDTIRFGWTEFDALSFAVQSGTDVHIDYGVGSTIILQDTALGALSATDFEFDATPIDDPGF